MRTDPLKLVFQKALVEYENNRYDIGGNLQYLFRNQIHLKRISLPNCSCEIGAYAFSGCSNLEEAYFPNATGIGSYAFNGCSKLTSIDLPKATIINAQAFTGCSKISSLVFPNVTSFTEDCFSGMTGLTNLFLMRARAWNGDTSYNTSFGTTTGSVVMPKFSGTLRSVFRYARFGSIDLGPDVTNMGAYNIGYQGTAPKNLILRRTAGVIAVGSGGIRGVNANTKVYVPSSLIDSYKAAASWSEKGDIFYAIEGSEYEHYYANGVGVFQDVTTNLINVTSSHATDDDIVSYGDPYSTTLMPNEGMTISSVEIIMSGVDITSTVYNDTTHEINIESVTGPIYITSTATASE